ncbi:hypothetical protein [Limnohabitans sp.]|uniref:hypothetical protein n=1 Tax=Limnohabitans sp. TaxID=1907725 RepID=UPI0025BD2757|nr:hypothetical protein [Limnohabitans sp.]
MNIFSEFQSKFPSKYSGQYIQEIIKSIANFELKSLDHGVPLVIKPFFKTLGINIRGVTDLTVESEIPFSGQSQDRRADLIVRFIDINKKAVSIFIEIKVDDQIIKAKKNTNELVATDQLDDYFSWLGAPVDEIRYFILFTAHPIKANHKVKIENKNTTRHLYFGSYHELLADKSRNSDSMMAIFLDYLKEEGYVMYKPQENDIDDFLSFMTLNFLPHASGHGRVVSERKIANGPIVFSKLVKNWQLISGRINAKLNSKGVPAVRYLPEQVTTILPSSKNLINNFTQHRIKMRNQREFGRMWLISEVVFSGTRSRISWGLVYSILKGGTVEDDDSKIKCQIIVSFRTGADVHCEIFGKSMKFEDYSEKDVEVIEGEIISLLEKLDQEKSLTSAYKTSLFEKK